MKIHTIPLGVDNCYIIQGEEKCLMIDAGTPKKSKTFLKKLTQFSLQPQDIQLIIITHGHWDHIGSAKEIKELTKAPIAMHELEKDYLEKASAPLPPGVTTWGKIFINLMKLFGPLIHFHPAQVDILLSDEIFSLEQYGISGKIIHTPGHTKGSVSILLDTGEAFVGDLAMDGFPLRFSPGLPILAEDMEQVYRSWRRLLEEGAKMVYPAHGKPFSAEIIRQALPTNSQ